MKMPWSRNLLRLSVSGDTTGGGCSIRRSAGHKASTGPWKECHRAILDQRAPGRSDHVWLDI
jgi:hypothetical protein